MPQDVPFAREWLNQWLRAGDALASVRASELAVLTPSAALAASAALLDLAAATPLPKHRERWSGLVEFQRLIHRASRT